MKGGPQARVSSPVFERSTLTTSAPRSASTWPAHGPARIRASSSTRNPDNGPGITTPWAANIATFREPLGRWGSFVQTLGSHLLTSRHPFTIPSKIAPRQPWYPPAMNASFFGEMLNSITDRGRALLDRARDRRGQAAARSETLTELCEELLSGRGEAS